MSAQNTPTSGECARYRHSDAVIEDGEYEAIYNEAERLADLLEDLGWVCGYPYREDVLMVLRLAMNARFLVPDNGGSTDA